MKSMFFTNRKAVALATKQMEAAVHESDLWFKTALSVDRLRLAEREMYHRTIAEMATEQEMLEAESTALLDALREAHNEIADLEDELEDMTNLADALVSFAIGGQIFVLVDGNAPAGAKSLEQAMDEAHTEQTAPTEQELIDAFRAGTAWRFDRAIRDGVEFGPGKCLLLEQIEDGARETLARTQQPKTLENLFHLGALWRFDRAACDDVDMSKSLVRLSEYDDAAREYAAQPEGREG